MKKLTYLFLTFVIGILIYSCTKEEQSTMVHGEVQIENRDAGVWICHKPDGNNPQAIYVDGSAEDSHLGHGDELLDVDGDGYTAANACGEGSMDDCDDNNAAVHPGATEVPYDGVDNDCDASTGCNDTDDKVGMNFTNSSDHLFNSDFAFSDDFTITFWFKTSANHSQYEGRIFNGNNSSNRFEIGIEDGSNKFWAYDHSQTHSSALSYNDGVWHHVIVRNEGTLIDFYVDGEFVFTSNKGSLSLTGGFNIGRWSFTNIAHYIGSLADFRIYNDALDLSSVLQEYECGIYENDDQLDLHYSFNEGIPNGDNTALTTVIDDSGNGNDADVVAMTLTGTESNYIEADDIQPCCN